MPCSETETAPDFLGHPARFAVNWLVDIGFRGLGVKWIIEGAQKYIQNDYTLIIPDTISYAIKSYQEENDWAVDFFEDRLIFEFNRSATGSELYDAYQKYCQRSTLQPLPQTVVLPRIAEHPGVTKKRTNKGMRYYGVE